MSLVRLTQSAQIDLLEAWTYIAEANMDAADGVLDADGLETSLCTTQSIWKC